MYPLTALIGTKLDQQTRELLHLLYHEVLVINNDDDGEGEIAVAASRSRVIVFVDSNNVIVEIYNE